MKKFRSQGYAPQNYLRIYLYEDLRANAPLHCLAKRFVIRISGLTPLLIFINAIFYENDKAYTLLVTKRFGIKITGLSPLLIFVNRPSKLHTNLSLRKSQGYAPLHWLANPFGIKITGLSPLLIFVNAIFYEDVRVTPIYIGYLNYELSIMNYELSIMNYQF